MTTKKNKIKFSELDWKIQLPLLFGWGWIIIILFSFLVGLISSIVALTL